MEASSRPYRQLLEERKAEFGSVVRVLRDRENENGENVEVVIRRTQKPLGRKGSGNLKAHNPYNVFPDANEQVIFKVLHSFDDPHVVRHLQYCVVDGNPELCLERITGGNIFHFIANKETHSERYCRDVCRTLLETIEKLHRSNILHRNIRPAAVFLRKPSDNSDDVVLVDFTVATIGGGKWNPTWSPECNAPEMRCQVPKPCTTAVDLWGIGLVAYSLLTGKVPFEKETDTKVLALIKKIGMFDFERPEGVSAEALDFVNRLLCAEEQRMSVQEALRHPWLASVDLVDVDLTPTLENMRGLALQLISFEGVPISEGIPGSPDSARTALSPYSVNSASSGSSGSSFRRAASADDDDRNLSVDTGNKVCVVAAASPSQNELISARYAELVEAIRVAEEVVRGVESGSNNGIREEDLLRKTMTDLQTAVSAAQAAMVN